MNVIGGVFPLFILAAVTQIPSNLAQTTMFSAHGEVSGSSFVYQGDKGKYLITNWHVCHFELYDDKVISGTLPDGTTVRGILVKEDVKTDLCAAKINSYDGPALTLARRGAKFGEVVFTRGYPLGHLSQTYGTVLFDTNYTYVYPIEMIERCVRGTTPVISKGRVIGCSVDIDNTIVTVFIEPGSSGSPVVNKDGRLVGVVESQVDGNPYEGGMVPFKSLLRFMTGL